MPEVVEVYITSEFIKSVAKDNYITHFTSYCEKYNNFNLTLPIKIKNIFSKGKFMYIELENGLYLACTFGLTGKYSLIEEKYCKIAFTITNNNNENIILYYHDKLNFGTIEVCSLAKINIKLSKLAPSVLNNFTNNDFITKLLLIANKKKKITIVGLLMEQDLIFSGIGNYLVAEILYHAKIDPNSLLINIVKNKELCNVLATSIKYIIKSVFYSLDVKYLCQDIYNFYKKNILTKTIHLDSSYNTFQYNVYGLKTDLLNNPIIKTKICKGRSTHWCPNVQKII